MRQGKTGDRIHQQHNIVSLVTKIFSDGRCDISAAKSDQRRLVGSRGNHHRPFQAFLTQVFINKFLHLPAPFTNKRDHVHIGIGVPGNHSHQNRFTHSGSSKDSQPLTLGKRKQSIESSHPYIQWLPQTSSFQWVHRIAHQWIFNSKRNRSFAVNRLAVTIKDSPNQSITGFIGRIFFCRFNKASGLNAKHFSKRHQQSILIPKPHHLGLNRRPIIWIYGAEASHRYRRAVTFKDQANNPIYLSRFLYEISFLDK